MFKEKVTKENLEIGKPYKFLCGSDIIYFKGIEGLWFQFTKNGTVWSELLESDLHLLEKVKN